jgi:hypothetical protein
MANLAGWRADAELGRRQARTCRVALDALAVQQQHALDSRLLAEAGDHPADERPVVLQHLVFEGDADQVAFRQRGIPGRLEKSLLVVVGIDVGGDGAREYDSGRDPDRQPHGHAGEAQPHGRTRFGESMPAQSQFTLLATPDGKRSCHSGAASSTASLS